jgi:hypothetical protein
MRVQRTSDSDALERWLAAEAEERVADAEAALAELASALPELAPVKGFATRVLVRAGREGILESERSPWVSRWPRIALAALGLGLCWLSLWVPAVVGALRDLWSPADLAEGAASALVAFRLWVAPLLGLARELGVLWQSLAEPLSTGPMLVLGACCVLVAAGALGLLRELVQSNRRWVYVDPI